MRRCLIDEGARTSNDPTMSTRGHRLACVLAAFALVACATGGEGQQDRALAGASNPPKEGGPDAPILPLPDEPDGSADLAVLGAELFFSPIVSEDGQVSCGSCHHLDHGLAHATPLSAVANRPTTATNSTTLLNVRYLYRLTWSGAFDSLDTHLDALIQSPKLMGSSWTALESRLSASAHWRERFGRVFADGVSWQHARAALLAYERSLVTPGAAFDRWLLGEKEALSESAEQGYDLFIEYGCVSCHQGMLVGGNMLQRLGVAREFFAERPGDAASALGRYSLTEREEDRHVFRVPSLRNVGLTAPYLHDGSAPTLEAVINVMGEYQLGWRLPADDVAHIVQFLRSLTGKQSGDEP